MTVGIVAAAPRDAEDGGKNARDGGSQRGYLVEKVKDSVGHVGVTHILIKHKGLIGGEEKSR